MTHYEIPPRPRSGLASYSTVDLEAELQRRRDEERAKQEAERKSREVEIVCQRCNGSGGIDREEGVQTCYNCHGSGKVKALLATKPTRN